MTNPVLPPADRLRRQSDIAFIVVVGVGYGIALIDILTQSSGWPFATLPAVIISIALGLLTWPGVYGATLTLPATPLTGGRPSTLSSLWQWC